LSLPRHSVDITVLS